ncbi:flavin monooxygenase-like protein [Jimgerdemannia flammicorona]|uniref:Flavin monooxygenase-like protein n=1 Tax=Jimgerdemannia flammicorona TaxID=994334 RepID=A0A433DH24_9FUNG|nr:flavin monooxygenase-like protein [Jimgerdemannia flammicorona]
MFHRSSLDFRIPSSFNGFSGKKVVVVGPGASGCDIAVELSYHAEVYLSSRNGTWLVPRVDKANLPIDMSISRLVWSLPGRFQLWYATTYVGIRPPGHLRPSHGFMDKWVPIAPNALLERISFGKVRTKPDISRFAENGRDVEFVDGTVIRDVDVVIYATGYGYRFEFVDPEVMTNGTITAKDQIDGKTLKENAWLWKGIIPPRHEGIAFIGLLEILHSQWTISELQVRYLTSLITGRTQHPLPTPAEMDLQIVAQRKTIPPTHLVNFEPAYLNYFDWLANEAAGATPEPLKIIREYGFGFWLKILTGPLVPSQWRLVGRDRWEGAKSVIEDCYRRIQEGDLIHVEIGSEKL